MPAYWRNTARCSRAPRSELPLKRMEALIDQIRADGVLVTARPLAARLPDPDDEMFLAVALAGRRNLPRDRQSPALPRPEPARPAGRISAALSGSVRRRAGAKRRVSYGRSLLLRKVGAWGYAALTRPGRERSRARPLPSGQLRRTIWCRARTGCHNATGTMRSDSFTCATQSDSGSSSIMTPARSTPALAGEGLPRMRMNVHYLDRLTPWDEVRTGA